MSNVSHIAVSDRDAFRRTVGSYAAKGYATIHSDPTSATLSRKKPFNWVLAIVLLFIPVLGWIALGAMLFASGRGSQVVEITLQADTSPAARQTATG